MSRRGEGRFVRIWLAPLVLVGALAALGGILVWFYSSWWVDPTRAPSSDQRASDGTTVFTSAGVDYATATRLLVIRVGEGALPAAELGLDGDGVRQIDPEVPVQVRVLGTDGALVLELVDSVSIATDDGAITRVELLPWGGSDYRDIRAVLESRAENIGWTAADLTELEDDLSAAQRASGDGRYFAELPPRSNIGAAVTARVSVDLDAAYTVLVIAVEPLPAE